jgi:SH3-like domain-containing protein
MWWTIMCCTLVFTTSFKVRKKASGKTLKATIVTLFLLGMLACLAPAIAQTHATDGKVTSGSELPIPRFISISKRNANLRVGPGKRYPVDWIYRRRGVPVLVTAEFQHWRKVLDVDGTEGWLHKTLLSGRRTAVVTDDFVNFHMAGNMEAPIIFRAEAGVMGALEACIGGWCRMEIRDRAGWIERHRIFGALPSEEFD